MVCWGGNGRCCLTCLPFVCFLKTGSPYGNGRRLEVNFVFGDVKEHWQTSSPMLFLIDLKFVIPTIHLACDIQNVLHIYNLFYTYTNSFTQPIFEDRQKCWFLNSQNLADLIPVFNASWFSQLVMYFPITNKFSKKSWFLVLSLTRSYIPIY